MLSPETNLVLRFPSEHIEPFRQQGLGADASLLMEATMIEIAKDEDYQWHTS